MKKCRRCQGTGWAFENIGGNPDEAGYEECSWCHGTGKDDQDTYVEVDDDWIFQESYED